MGQWPQPGTSQRSAGRPRQTDAGDLGMRVDGARDGIVVERPHVALSQPLEAVLELRATPQFDRGMPAPAVAVGWLALAECTTAGGTEADVGWVSEETPTVEAGGVEITFDEVTTPGTITVTPEEEPSEEVPTDFRVLDAGWEVETDAGFSDWVYIEFPYDESTLPGKIWCVP